MSYIDRAKLSIKHIDDVAEISYDNVPFLHAKLRVHMANGDIAEKFLDLIYARSKAIQDKTSHHHQKLSDCDLAYIAPTYLIPLDTERFVVCSREHSGILGIVPSPIEKGLARSVIRDDGFYGALYSLRVGQHEPLVIVPRLQELRARIVQSLNAGVVDLAELPELSHVQRALAPLSVLVVTLVLTRLPLSRSAPETETSRIFFRLSAKHDVNMVRKHIQNQLDYSPETSLWM